MSIHPSALIVHAHPESGSFTAAQARAAQESLEAQGYSVEFLDLYAKGWAPVLDRGEFPPFDGHFKPQQEQWDAVREGTLAADVRADLDAVTRADLLVLSFPLWWFSLPAILKGWMDRVFAMGSVWGGDSGIFEGATLAGRRAVLLTTTGGSAESFAVGGRYGHIDDFLFHINRGMLEFVGYDALKPVITHAPARMSEAQRDQALGEVRQAFGALDTRPLASTARTLTSAATTPAPAPADPSVRG